MHHVPHDICMCDTNTNTNTKKHLYLPALLSNDGHHTNNRNTLLCVIMAAIVPAEVPIVPTNDSSSSDDSLSIAVAGGTSGGITGFLPSVDTNNLLHIPINLERLQRQIVGGSRKLQEVFNENTEIVLDLQESSHGLQKIVSDKYARTAETALIKYVSNSTALTEAGTLTICPLLKNLNRLPPHDDIARLTTNSTDAARCKKSCTNALSHSEDLHVMHQNLNTIGNLAADHALQQSTTTGVPPSFTRMHTILLFKLTMMVLFELPTSALKKAFCTNLSRAMLTFNFYNDTTIVPDSLRHNQRAFDYETKLDDLSQPLDDSRPPSGHRLHTIFAAAGNVLMVLHTYRSMLPPLSSVPLQRAMEHCHSNLALQLAALQHAHISAEATRAAEAEALRQRLTQHGARMKRREQRRQQQQTGSNIATTTASTTTITTAPAAATAAAPALLRFSFKTGSYRTTPRTTSTTTTTAPSTTIATL